MRIYRRILGAGRWECVLSRWAALGSFSLPQGSQSMSPMGCFQIWCTCVSWGRFSVYEDITACDHFSLETHQRALRFLAKEQGPGKPQLAKQSSISDLFQVSTQGSGLCINLSFMTHLFWIHVFFCLLLILHCLLKCFLSSDPAALRSPSPI